MVDVKPLSQMDPRWKDKKLGFDSLTIGKYGCLLTCMTMVANSYGFEETPDTLNEKMKKVSGYQGALIIPGALPAALPGMLYRKFIQCRDQPAPLAEIDASLARGKPVIVEVDYAPEPGLQNHWVVLYEKRGGDYLLRDPYPYPCETQEVSLLNSRYKFAGSPSKMIQAALFLEGGKASDPKQPGTDLDKGIRASFPVYSTVDGLALRSQTRIADDTLIKRLGLGVELIVLEEDAAVKAKLGKLDQWLPVKDPSDGTAGYVAAWFVTMETDGITMSRPARPILFPGEAPKILVVRTVGEGVALRSKPEISEAALVKRVPVNTELLCVEPYAAALSKVGVLYQWLKVRDITNSEYYVAAWYVEAVTGQVALGVSDVAADTPGDLSEEKSGMVLVRAAVEGLALRSMPVIAADTLLKRLPVDGELVVLEPRDVVEGKIGKMGEWLHVRDAAGQEGYVAAWYTVKSPEPAFRPGQPG